VDTPAVSVIASSDEGTRAALAEARRLAAGPAKVVVIRLAATLPPTGLARDCRALAAQAGFDATVRLCVSRGYREVLAWMIGRPPLIVVGGRRRWWWPTRAQRMTRALERAGHRVVFADVS
jgi:hypothetical protein